MRRDRSAATTFEPALSAASGPSDPDRRGARQFRVETAKKSGDFLRGEVDRKRLVNSDRSRGERKRRGHALGSPLGKATIANAVDHVLSRRDRDANAEGSVPMNPAGPRRPGDRGGIAVFQYSAGKV